VQSIVLPPGEHNELSAAAVYTLYYEADEHSVNLDSDPEHDRHSNPHSWLLGQYPAFVQFRQNSFKTLFVIQLTKDRDTH